MKKAIITGSTGFIGSSFTQFLVSKGIDVLAIGRKDLINVSQKRRKKIEGATYINLDMKNICNFIPCISNIIISFIMISFIKKNFFCITRK